MTRESPASATRTRSPTETIHCQGVRTHNLKNFTVDIPLGKWTTVTGVSGSGKSSLVFDTVFAEAQRRFLETLGTYERQFIEGLPQGEADVIENLPAAVALKQTNRVSDPRSVLATAADLAEPLRLLFAALMDPSCAQCGTPVVQHTLTDMVDFLKRQPAKSVAILAVRLDWPDDEDSRAKLADLLVREGHIRVLDRGRIRDLTELLEEKSLASLPAETPLVLDRIATGTGDSELLSRADAVWSQVRLASRFSSVQILSQEGKELEKFLVNPWCPKCAIPTTTIQQTDLDWQSVLGACPRCTGVGNVPTIDARKVIPNEDASLEDDALRPWSTSTYSWFRDNLLKGAQAAGVNTKAPWKSLDDETREWIWTGADPNRRFARHAKKHVSLKDFFDGLEAERYKTTARVFLARYRKYVTCPDCDGHRLSPAGRNAACLGRHFHELMEQEVTSLLAWVESLRGHAAFLHREKALRDLHEEVHRKLFLLGSLGLGSVQLWRRCRTLSGGEYQRVLLTRVLGNGLTDSLFVLDEPTVGLGRQEIPFLIHALMELRDLGNTILVVEHDLDIIRASDHWVELGPGGGEDGGHLMPIGKSPKSAIFPRTRLAREMERRTVPPYEPIFPALNRLMLEGFSANNCRDLRLEVPFGRLTVITGPSGAGKTTLVRQGLNAALEHFLENHQTSNREANPDDNVGTWTSFSVPENFEKNSRVITVEQRPMARAVTSVVATVLGVMDGLRRLFAQTVEAKAKGMTPGDFSFNSQGACEECSGRGVIREDLFFLGEIEKTCPSCGGSRYRSRVLDIEWQGRSIHGWLNTNLRDCLPAFRTHSSLITPLTLAVRLGLGHLPLGISTTQISGGEAQRLRIAAALSQPGNLPMFAVLDEPTRGLSEVDVADLLVTILELCQQGSTFCIIEHHEEFIRYAHQLIVLGPGAGREGGQIIRRELCEEDGRHGTKAR